MKTEYDRTVDAAYFSFSVAASARQEKLDDARIIDYDADGEVVGVEFITPLLGMDMTGVPRNGQGARATIAARRNPPERLVLPRPVRRPVAASGRSTCPSLQNVSDS